MRFTKPARPRRRPPLTPMIDVVFLLLVFFMLASRFGLDMVLPMPLAGGAELGGPPRLVEVLARGYRLNGIACDDDALLARLGPLVQEPGQAIVLRGGAGVDVQRIVTAAELLHRAGYGALVLVE